MSETSINFELPITDASLRSYLKELGFSPFGELDLRPLGEDGASLKGFGYGKPLLVEMETREGRQRVVVHTLAPNAFGHDRPSDRAENLLLAHHTFNRLPGHVQAFDVGVFSEGRMISLGRSGEYFLVTEFAEGELYARDLERIRDTGRIEARDEDRAGALGEYLARIHAKKHGDTATYHRRIRDLVGHGEGIMGLTDSYPDVRASVLKRIEHASVDWRWRLRRRADRLSQVHGDFHPFNILFDDSGTLRLLDRSRGEWGEPADDVTALSINYVFFSLQSTGRWEGPLVSLFERFWNAYLAASGDLDLHETAPPFFAWRGLVVASPVWYPTIPESVRNALFQFIENVLADTRFEPRRIADYLEVRS